MVIKNKIRTFKTARWWKMLLRFCCQCSPPCEKAVVALLPAHVMFLSSALSQCTWPSLDPIKNLRRHWEQHRGFCHHFLSNVFLQDSINLDAIKLSVHDVKWHPKEQCAYTTTLRYGLKMLSSYLVFVCRKKPYLLLPLIYNNKYGSDMSPPTSQS